MIQFFINNTEIVLPEDYQLTLIDENALITKSGEFSLDIDTSLLEPINARAFNHLYRLNKSTINVDGDCRLIINGIVKIGKYVVLSHSNTSVKWQFIAGNSEVIYVTGESKKIWELDFGTETEIDFTRAMSSITNPSYINKFICVPIQFSNCIANEPIVEGLDSYHGGKIIGMNNIVMQPYLLYYINKLPELLGFSLLSNVLNSDPRATIEFIPNRVQSLKYSDALPDMTIAEFISAIEYSFNVVFNFMSENKTVEIINTKSYIENKKIVKLNNVIDEYSREPSTEVYRFDFTKLSYDIGTSGYLRYQKLSDDLFDNTTKIEHRNFTYLKNSLVQADLNKFVIHIDTNTNKHYVYCTAPALNVYRRTINAMPEALIYVNKFRSYGTDSEKELIMGVSPLCYTIGHQMFYFIENQGADYEINAIYQLPLIDSTLYISENQIMIEAIESSIEKIPRPDKIEVGLYNGLMLFSGQNLYCEYPISFVDKLPEFYCSDSNTITSSQSSPFELWVEDVFKIKATQTLRLNDSDGIFANYYVENSKFETSFIYTFYLEDFPDLKSSNLFEYQNQLYVPIKFERTISNKNTLVTGYFYRMITQ